MLNLQRLLLSFFLLTIPAYANSELTLFISEDLTFSEKLKSDDLYPELLIFCSTISEFLSTAELPSRFDPTLQFILDSLKKSLSDSAIIPPCIKELNETFTALLALNASITTINLFIESNMQTTIDLKQTLGNSVYRMRETARINFIDLKQKGGIFWGSPLIEYYSHIIVLSELFKIYYLKDWVDPKILTYKNLMASKS
jgi:hypothetical protein